MGRLLAGQGLSANVPTATPKTQKGHSHASTYEPLPHPGIGELGGLWNLGDLFDLVKSFRLDAVRDVVTPREVRQAIASTELLRIAHIP